MTLSSKYTTTLTFENFFKVATLDKKQLKELVLVLRDLGSAGLWCLQVFFASIVGLFCLHSRSLLTLASVLRASAPPPPILPTHPPPHTATRPSSSKPPRKQHSITPAHANSNSRQEANEKDPKLQTQGGGGGMCAGSGAGVEGSEAEVRRVSRPLLLPW